MNLERTDKPEAAAIVECGTERAKFRVIHQQISSQTSKVKGGINFFLLNVDVNILKLQVSVPTMCKTFVHENIVSKVQIMVKFVYCQLALSQKLLRKL